ncbi:MAG: AP-4-A phosphorylase [Actinobacteria bacterium ADurb.Bin444]|nr:MAG: AP-4-A phosphorylase [Actinobacteria bacterium ADurb.Bin444]
MGPVGAAPALHEKGERLDVMWAPWRMEYIGSPKPTGCIFCEKPTAGDDPANHIVWRGNHAFVLLNAYPYNNGHLMVAPYKHIANLEDLAPDVTAEMMRLCQDAIRALKRDFNPDGVNMGINLGSAAGAGVKDHLHIHVVPRWNGDTNFMSVITDTRVIPQSLDESYRILHAAFTALRD